MSKPQGLIRRGNVWHYRRRVPLALVQAFNGRRELKQSLGTSDLREAKQRRNLVAAKFDAEIAHIRDGVRSGVPCAAALLRDEAQKAIRRYVEIENAKRSESFESTDWCSDPDGTYDARHEAALLATHYTDPSHEATALGVSIAAREIFGENVSAKVVAENWELLRRAILELERRQIRRFKGDYRAPTSDFTFAARPDRASDGKSGHSIRLSELVSQYSADYDKTNRVGSKRREKVSAALKLIIEFFGAETPLSQITRARCREFQDLLNELPSNMRKHFRSADVEWDAIVAEAKRRRLPVLARDTQSMYLGVLNRIVKWAVREGHLTTNPAEGLEALGPKVPDKEARYPFTTAQLRNIFDAPLYRGCLDDGRNYAQPGPHVIRGTRFWVPVLALYTGARENELCQLECEAIQKSELGTWFICFNEDAPDRRIKTHVKRMVPIHLDLIKMGLLQFVAKRRRSSARLFPDLKLSARGYYSDSFCRWFNEGFLPKAGAKTEKTSFHSFRHSFRDALRRIDAPPAVVEGIGGWKAEHGVSSRYGSGLSVDELAVSMQRIRFDGIDLSHLYA